MRWEDLLEEGNEFYRQGGFTKEIAFPYIVMVGSKPEPTLQGFTHIEDGKEAVRPLLRGYIFGSFGIAAFYALIASLLPVTQSLWIYAIAGAITMGLNALTLRLLQKNG